MGVKILERLNRSWIDKPTWQMPQTPNLPSNKPRWLPPVSAGFSFGDARGAFRDCPCSRRKYAGIEPPNAE